MTEYQLPAMSRAGETGETIFRAPSVGCSGETDHILEGWRIEPDEEGVRVVSPSGDGCYVWGQDSRNAPAFMGICQREVFRQLCQTLAAGLAATGETS